MATTSQNYLHWHICHTCVPKTTSSGRNLVLTWIHSSLMMLPAEILECHLTNPPLIQVESSTSAVRRPCQNSEVHEWLCSGPFRKAPTHVRETSFPTFLKQRWCPSPPLLNCKGCYQPTCFNSFWSSSSSLPHPLPILLKLLTSSTLLRLLALTMNICYRCRQVHMLSGAACGNIWSRRWWFAVPVPAGCGRFAGMRTSQLRLGKARRWSCRSIDINLGRFGWRTDFSPWSWQCCILVVFLVVPAIDITATTSSSRWCRSRYYPQDNSPV